MFLVEANEKYIDELEQFKSEVLIHDKDHADRFAGCCGLDCEKCDARIATVTNNNALRGKTAALWTKLNGTAITPEMINCTGCRVMYGAQHCVRAKGLDTCADCAQMDGCPTLGRIAVNSPFVLEDLKRLREVK